MELGKWVMARPRLYLDLRFWNDLCDVELGESRSDGAAATLDALRTACGRDAIVCAVEYYVYAELAKQSRGPKLGKTLGLIDELSRKTVIASPYDRVRLEFVRNFQALRNQAPLTHPPRSEVWTRPAYVVGHAQPDLPSYGLPEDLAAKLKAEFWESMWDFGFSDIHAVAGPPPSDSHSQTADLLNNAKSRPEHQLGSLRETYEAEVRGALDGFEEEMRAALEILRREAGADRPMSAPEAATAVAQAKRIAAYAIIVRGLQRPFASIHVAATLYARMQWDRKRLYKPNDIFDLGHAEAAIPYCSAMATDRGLATLLRQSGLPAEYGCEVLSSHEELQCWLASDSAA